MPSDADFEKMAKSVEAARKAAQALDAGLKTTVESLKQARVAMKAAEKELKVEPD